jgi:hypothetical protein
VPHAEFQGEQAISSALLAQAMPDKPVVVFVTPAPQPPNQLYSVIMQRLTQANFKVETWAAGRADATAPAQGKGVVWIVLPGPPQSPQQMMMGMSQPNTAPIHAALAKHLAAGGSALFLAEAQSTPLYGRGPTGYPYADVLKPFGVDVAANYVVVQRYTMQDQERVIPQLTLKRYPNTPITKPLQSLPTLLAGFDMHTAAPTVVRPAADPPAGAHPQVLLEAQGSDVWGESSALGAPEFDKTSDLAAPVPLGVMSTGPHDARVVVIGNAIFASNEALNLQTPVMTAGGSIYMVPNYPGNAELMLNSVYWLAGYDNMIAVSPRASAALRIRDIPPGTLMALDWGVLWAGAPLLLLVIGGVVYACRR